MNYARWTVSCRTAARSCASARFWLQRQSAALCALRACASSSMCGAAARASRGDVRGRAASTAASAGRRSETRSPDARTSRSVSSRSGRIGHPGSVRAGPARTRFPPRSGSPSRACLARDPYAAAHRRRAARRSRGRRMRASALPRELNNPSTDNRFQAEADSQAAGSTPTAGAQSLDIGAAIAKAEA